MRSSQLFISLVSLLFCFFLFFCGIFLYFVPHVPSLLEKGRNLFLEHPETLSKIGLGLAIISISILILFARLNRRKYFLIRMGGKVSIHEKIIKEIVFQCLTELFPESRVVCDVIVHRKNRVEILADIPKIDEKNENIYEKIENALYYSLNKCGIQEEILLNVRFN